MGALLILISSFGFSTIGILGKWAYDAGFSRNQMLALRFGLSLPILFLILKLTRSLSFNPQLWAKTIAVGAIGIGIEASLYFACLKEIGAGLTGVFLYLYPAFVAILSHFFLNHRLSRRDWIWVGVALLGCGLTVDPTGVGLSQKGIILGVLTGLWYALYLLAGDRVMQSQNPLQVSTGVVTGAALVFAALVVWDGQGIAPEGASLDAPSALATWGPIVGLVFLGSVVPFTTLYAGMKRTGPVMASVLSMTELVFTLVLAAWLLNEKMTVWQWAGAVMVLAGAYFIRRV